MKIILTILLAVSLTACSTGEKNIEESQDNIEVVNPYVKYDSLDSASKSIGFGFNLSDKLQENIESIYLIDNEIYSVKLNLDNDLIEFRKAKSMNDISGDFNSYDEEKSIKINDNDVVISLNDKLIYQASWQMDDYSYNLSSENGLDEEKLSEIILEIN